MKSRLVLVLVVQPKLTLHGVAFSGLNGPLSYVKGGLSQYSESSCFAIERFHSRGQHLYKFFGTKESVCIRKEFISHGIAWYTNMADVSLFWNTNMTAVKSCENALLLLTQ